MRLLDPNPSNFDPVAMIYTFEKYVPQIIMIILKTEIAKNFKKEINSVLNLKIVNGDSRKYD